MTVKTNAELRDGIARLITPSGVPGGRFGDLRILMEDMADSIDDASLSSVTATGLVAARTQADRAADVIHVEEFRGDGGDPSDTNAVQLAVNHVRDATGNNSYREAFITGQNHGRYVIEESIDATDIDNFFNWGIRDLLLRGTCTGKAILDLSGSRYGVFSNVHMYGPEATLCSHGWLVSRLSDNNPAGDHDFENCTGHGFFLQALHLNRAGEEITYKNCIWENSLDADEDNAALAFALDGAGTIPAASDYQTLSTGNQAFNQINVLGSKFKKGDGASGSAAFFSRIVEADIKAYFVCHDAPHIEFLLTGVERDISIKGHFEGDAPTCMVKFTGAASARTVHGLTLQDHSPHVLDNIFQIDGPTGVTLPGLELRVFSYNAGTLSAGIFDDVSKYTIRNGDLFIPTFADYGTLANYGGKAGTIFRALDSLGAMTDRITLIDGITAPAAIAGKAQIFVDTADGDLKVIYGDGTTKLIVADT